MALPPKRGTIGPFGTFYSDNGVVVGIAQKGGLGLGGWEDYANPF